MKRSVYKILMLLAASLVFLPACENNNASPKKAYTAPTTPFKPAELLKYDSKQADKKIDNFFHWLHNKAGFNGNILVAKNGHILYEGALGWANHLTRDSLKLN